jgi:hypothetical protein
MSEKEQPNESVATELPSEVDVFEFEKLKAASEELARTNEQINAWTENKIKAQGALAMIEAIVAEKYKITDKDKILPDRKIIRNP